jgi:hypothetical protein
MKHVTLSMGKPDSPIHRITTRTIGDKRASILYVRAGGRCEFHGCNKYLFRHHLTHEENNFSEKAHIVAYREDGPRGKSLGRPTDIHDLDNLMLLCPPCHKHIDDNPHSYPVEKLREFKRDHEDRIFRLTETKPDHKTKIVRVTSRVGGQKVSISAADIKEAVFPRYPQDPHGLLIDLSDIPDDGDDHGESFYKVAMQTIVQKINPLYERGIDTDSIDHISVFALAPIPLLIFLGSQLSNKVPVEVYQRHRDTENWIWKTHGQPVVYEFHQLRQGSDISKVALVLSLSGRIRIQTLPSEIDESFYVYELTLDNQIPAPTFLQTKQNLDDFKQAYQRALRFISSEHLKPKELHLFPAVPAPIAVLCGRELMPKIDPVLLVYDDDKKQGGFKLKVRVNER